MEEDLEHFNNKTLLLCQIQKMVNLNVIIMKQVSVRGKTQFLPTLLNNSSRERYDVTNTTNNIFSDETIISN